MEKMKVIIFGTGKKYKELKKYMDHLDVAAFLDNNPVKEYSAFEQKAVYNPARIPKDLRYEAILIMTVYYSEIKRQLMETGIEENKIYSFFQIGELLPETISKKEIYIIEDWKRARRRFLLIQHDGSCGGATIALANLAIALSKKYSVLVSIPTEGETIFFYKKNRIPYICNIQMNCDTKVFQDIVSSADIVLVNSVTNNNVIELLRKKGRHFYLWLHDHSTTYDRSDCMLLKKSIDSNTGILAVSRKAADVFYQYVKREPYRLFPLAIQDYEVDVNDKNRHILEIPTLVVIGDLCRIKGQDILLNALGQVRYKFRLKLIGGVGNDPKFSDRVMKCCEEQASCEYLGRLANEEIHRLYRQGEINILICPSRFETLSIASIEAMSYGVPVIVSDMTGIAEYIKEAEPNCIFKSEDSSDLRQKIEWILSSRENSKKIGDKLKDLYNEKFSIEQLEKGCAIFDEYNL